MNLGAPPSPSEGGLLGPSDARVLAQHAAPSDFLALTQFPRPYNIPCIDPLRTFPYKPLHPASFEWADRPEGTSPFFGVRILTSNL